MFQTGSQSICLCMLINVSVYTFFSEINLRTTPHLCKYIWTLRSVFLIFSDRTLKIATHLMVARSKRRKEKSREFGHEIRVICDHFKRLWWRLHLLSSTLSAYDTWEQLVASLCLNGAMHVQAKSSFLPDSYNYLGSWLISGNILSRAGNYGEFRGIRF